MLEFVVEAAQPGRGGLHVAVGLLEFLQFLEAEDEFVLVGDDPEFLFGGGELVAGGSGVEGFLERFVLLSSEVGAVDDIPVNTTGASSTAATVTDIVSSTL